MYITNNIDKGKQTDKQEKKTINNIQLKCRFVSRTIANIIINMKAIQYIWLSQMIVLVKV